MPRVSKTRILENKEYYTFLDDFYSAITSLQDKKEVKVFLQDFLTREEVLMLAKRFQTAMMLVAGYTEREIDQRVKVTQSTVSRIKTILELGRGGLLNVVNRIIKVKTEMFKKKYARRGYRFAESELLKQAVLFSISKIAQKITRTRKEKSITT